MFGELEQLQRMKIMYYEKETWVVVPGFENYEVSSIGNVRKKADQKLIRQWLAYNDTRNYLTCTLIDKHGKMDTRYVHMVVAAAFLGKKPKSKERIIINHKNGIKHDNRASNLEYITQRANVQHAYRTGLNTRSIDVEILDNTTGEVHHLHSVSKVGEFLKVHPLSVYPLLGRHVVNPYRGKFTFKYNEEKIGTISGVSGKKKIIYYDCIVRAWVEVSSICEACIRTGIRLDTIKRNSRNNSQDKSKKIMTYGYYFFHGDTERKIPIFTTEEATASREKLFKAVGFKF